MTPRFTKQRSDHCCFPTAVANTFKWAGIPFSYRKNRDGLKKLMDCDADGAYSEPAELGFRCLNSAFGEPLKITRLRNPTLKQMEEHLRKGGVVLLGTQYSPTEAHAHLVESIARNTFRVINGINTWNSNKKTIRYLPRSKMKKLLRMRPSTGWFVEKRVHYSL